MIDQEEIEIKPKPQTMQEMANSYGISIYLMKREIKKLIKKRIIDKPDGSVMNIKTVRIIYNNIGAPTNFTEKK